MRGVVMATALALPLLVAAKPLAPLQPVRYVFQVKGDLTVMKPMMELQHGLCALELRAKGQEVGPLTLPSAAVLAGLVVLQEERLFDGGLEAVFEMRAQVLPDPQQSCKLRVERSFSASAVQTCGMGWSGSSDAKTDSPDGSTSAPRLTALEDGAQSFKSMGKSCGLMSGEKRGPKSFEGVVQTATAIGLACVWLDVALDGKPETQPGYLRHCVLPGDPLQGRQRRLFGARDHFTLVTEMVGLPPTEALRTTAGSYNFGQGEAVAFEVGLPIPKQRFTKQAVHDFINQPRWVDLGDAKDPLIK